MPQRTRRNARCCDELPNPCSDEDRLPSSFQPTSRWPACELAERLAEALDDFALHLCHRYLATQLALQAGNAVLADAAGGYAVVPGEFRGDVEGEAVGGDPAG